MNPFQDPRAAYAQGVAHGQAQAAQQFEHRLAQAVGEVQANFQQALNRTAGGLRKESRDQIDKAAESFDQRLSDMAKIAEALTATRTGASGEQDPGTIRVENMPGRRVPYIALVEIPIQGRDTSIREQSWTVSQDGVFVATRRWATFLSAFEFQVLDVETGERAKFPGRSYGRYRPPHSAFDIMDAQAHMANSALWYLMAYGPGGGGGGVIMPGANLALPSNMSSFRTMQFDGRIAVENAGSSFPRQNRAAPSAWWATEANGPVELGALDVFERGEVITWKVQPNHEGNPPHGNVHGSCIFPSSGSPDCFPFLDGQFDPHEGVQTPAAVTTGEGSWEYNPTTEDPITRLPDGFLILAYEGYRIIQTPGLTL